MHLDPVELLHRIRNVQSALAALESSETSTGIDSDNLKQFLASLPHLWRSGEVRPTHRSAKPKARNYRTREDPFIDVWPEILIWLQKTPETPAKTLFQRLQGKYPDRYSDGQLRTLQRRVKEWRKIMARKLVYAGLDGGGEGKEIIAIGMEKTSAGQ